MDTVEHDAPDLIGPETTTKQGFGARVGGKARSIVKSFTTKYVG
jgi:hypothetical protein